MTIKITTIKITTIKIIIIKITTIKIIIIKKWRHDAEAAAAGTATLSAAQGSNDSWQRGLRAAG
eukprot:4675903-Pleurochrysis_carterae.AAC.2